MIIIAMLVCHVSGPQVSYSQKPSVPSLRQKKGLEDMEGEWFLFLQFQPPWNKVNWPVLDFLFNLFVQ